VYRIFERYPQSKALFSRVHVDELDSPEFKAHLVRITNGLDIIVNLFDSPMVLLQEVEHLAAQHAAREGMKGEYMKVISRCAHLQNPMLPVGLAKKIRDKGYFLNFISDVLFTDGRQPEA